jgi:hypothetical protein
MLAIPCINYCLQPTDTYRIGIQYKLSQWWYTFDVTNTAIARSNITQTLTSPAAIGIGPIPATSTTVNALNYLSCGITTQTALCYTPGSGKICYCSNTTPLRAMCELGKHRNINKYKHAHA